MTPAGRANRPFHCPRPDPLPALGRCGAPDDPELSPPSGRSVAPRLFDPLPAPFSLWPPSASASVGLSVGGTLGRAPPRERVLQRTHATIDRPKSGPRPDHGLANPVLMRVSSDPYLVRLWPSPDLAWALGWRRRGPGSAPLSDAPQTFRRNRPHVPQGIQEGRSRYRSLPRRSGSALRVRREVEPRDLPPPEHDPFCDPASVAAALRS